MGRIKRGVPIVFATYPLIAGIEKANMIFNIVFFISVTSVLIQGTTLTLVAEWLHVALPEKVKPLAPTEAFLSDRPKTIMQEILVNNNNQIVGKKIVDLAFPKTAFITMIKREDKYLTPSGSTILEGNDILIVITDNENSLNKVYESLNIPTLT